MKVLVISDVHSKENDKLINYLNNNDIDLVLISGDITDFGPLDFVNDFIGKILDCDCDVVAIPGNCDPNGICNAIEESGAYCLHKKVISYENLVIFGYGGSNPTPFDTPGEIEETKIYNDLFDLFSEYEFVANDKKKNIKILLTHAPPADTKADLTSSGDHVGSQSIKRIIQEFNIDINLCGHIHEAQSIDEMSGTIIVNPGMLEHGSATLIDTNEDNSFDINIISL
ncbi:metallophosphoesterase [Methanobrevibacter sp. DSM 116169]|uniref:metallophosphoesterase family protein n=1 Tax=Methanobrevibacter sp. DSM 116169 TaxID=3242727 RepID=UPI0038FCF038